MNNAFRASTGGMFLVFARSLNTHDARFCRAATACCATINVTQYARGARRI